MARGRDAVSAHPSTRNKRGYRRCDREGAEPRSSTQGTAAYAERRQQNGGFAQTGRHERAVRGERRFRQPFRLARVARSLRAPFDFARFARESNGGGAGICTRVRKYIPAGIYDAYPLLKFRSRREEAAKYRRKLALENLIIDVQRGRRRPACLNDIQSLAHRLTRVDAHRFLGCESELRVRS